MDKRPLRDVGRVVAQIPARAGSKRLPAKNLRLLNGKPMIGYAIECALAADIFDAVMINTDSDAMAELGAAYGIKVYRRPSHLGSDEARGDDFTADFIERVRPDTVALVNPVCPLIEVSDIRNAFAAFRQDDCDTLISCEQTQMQVFCDERPINIAVTTPLAPSQQNPVVKILNFAITLWDAHSFMIRYRNGEGAYIGKQRVLFPIPALHALKISHESDFMMAQALLRARAHDNPELGPALYWAPGDSIIH